MNNMSLNQQCDALKWTPVPQWASNRLIGFDDAPGLIRFRQSGEIVYIGMETKSVANYTRFLTPGGSWKNHAGGRLVHDRRQHLTLEYALLGGERADIERVRDALIAKHAPAFNFPEYKPKSP